MKSLRGRAEISTKEDAQPKSHGTGPGWMKRTFLACAAAATMALGTPLLGRDALSQPRDPPVVDQPERPAEARPATARKLFTVKGEPTTIKDGSQVRDVYISAMNLKPMLEVQGPARITLKVYPVVERSRFADGALESSLSIQCASGPAGETQITSHYAGKTGPSQIIHPDVKSDMVIGTPIQFTADVGKGAQQFRLISPHGFLEVVSVEPAAPPRPAARPRALPRFIAPRERPKPMPAPVKPKAPAHEGSPLFDAAFERFELHGFGPEKNKGDVYLAEAVGHIPLKKGMEILLGIYSGSAALTLDTPDAKATLRGVSADLGLGFAFTRKGHRMDAVIMGGYAAMLVDVEAKEGPSLKKTEHAFEYGGQLRYRYGHHIGVSLMGSNNPFNPLIGKVHGVLPWGWVRGYKPWLEADLLWMHPLTSYEAPGKAGAAELRKNELHLRALAGVPLFGINRKGGSFSLAALAGGEMGASTEGVSGGGLFGLAMMARIRGMDLYLAGLSSHEGAPVVMLRLGYSR
ncbi:MAG: hypothetical protein V1827_04425 [Candidatus Micrarchaeota archaeon]